MPNIVFEEIDKKGKIAKVIIPKVQYSVPFLKAAERQKASIVMTEMITIILEKNLNVSKSRFVIDSGQK